MHTSASEKSSAYQLTWSLRVVPSTEDKGAPVLELDYAVEAFEELYVADRLWDDDPVSYRVPDPFGVYRFVQNGSLRLVFAQAPKPPNVMIANPRRPLYSRILAGETRRKTVQLKLPVDEYSGVGLGRDVNAPTAIEEVSRVFFVLGYCLRSSLDRAPTPPMRETAEDAGYVVYESQLMISELHVDRLQVKRRTGYMARFPLPGEPGPDPMPIESPR
jgi:hypothetical protein